MQKSIDIDKVILFLLPVALSIILFTLDEKSVYFGGGIIIAIFIYEIIIFDKRYLYGYNGLRYLSIPSIIFFTFTIFIGLPSVYICSIYSHPAIYSYFISVILFYLLYPLGLHVGFLIRPVHLNEIESLNKSDIVKSNIDKYFFTVLIVLLSFSIIILVVYFIRVKTIPLFEMIKNPGGYYILGRLREESLKLLDITIIERYLFHWLRNLFLPFGIICSLFLHLNYRLKKYRNIFIFYFILGIFINSLTLEKSPVAAIFLSIVAFIFLIKKRITFKFILISLIAIFGAPIIIMYFLLYENQNVFSVLLSTMLNRIFVIPSEAVFRYFTIFPSNHEFLLGRATHLFSWLHSDGIFSISNYVAKVWWQKPLTTGSANTMFIGNFWADFGYIGVVSSIFVVGIIIHFIYYKLISVAGYLKNIIYTVFSAILVPIFTFNFFSSNITILFFTRGLILAIIFLFVYEKIIKTSKIR